MIAVPAAAAIDRAGVQTGSAANAAERLAVLLVWPRSSLPPIVDQHHVQFAAGHRAVKMRRVGGDRLPGRVASQQTREDRQIR